MAREEVHVEEKKTPKGRKKVMIITGVVVLASVALIAGVVLYNLAGHNSVSAAEAGSEKKVEPAKKKLAPVVYPMEPFIVNISDGHDMRYLKVKVELDVTTVGEVKAEIDPYLAPLRDSILVLLSSKTLQEVQDLQGKNRLREEILATASKILPPGKINRVYFTDFVVQ